MMYIDKKREKWRLFLSFNELIQILAKNGWTLKRTGRSSLRVFTKDGKTIVLHYHGNAEVPKGTAAAILKQAGIK